MLFALVVIIIVDKRYIAKGVVAAFLGVMIATIGVDVLQPISRFTFGTELLVEGVNIMPIVIGAFAISEVLTQAQNWNLSLSETLAKAKDFKVARRDFIPKLSEIREIGNLHLYPQRDHRLCHWNVAGRRRIDGCIRFLCNRTGDLETS